MLRIFTLLGLLVSILTAGTVTSARASDIADWSPFTQQKLSPGDSRYFDMAYSESWAAEVLEELGGGMVTTKATRGEYAMRLRELLAEQLGVTRSVALARPPVPQWLMDGYLVFQPRTVAGSRWMDDVNAWQGQLKQSNPKVRPDAEIAALFSYYSMFDAEWFNASRNGAYKAWLTALQLSYPADWQRLNRESKAELEQRLVAPLRTCLLYTSPSPRDRG
jgi:hypothetical protein